MWQLPNPGPSPCCELLLLPHSQYPCYSPFLLAASEFRGCLYVGLQADAERLWNRSCCERCAALQRGNPLCYDCWAHGVGKVISASSSVSYALCQMVRFPRVQHGQALAEDFPPAPRVESATGKKHGTAWGCSQQTKQEWSCSSASQRSALLCFLWLTAGGGSSLPVYTLPCALLLNPRLPDSRKSSKSQQLLPLHSLPPRRNGEKGALSASPGLFPRRTLQNCSYFPELLEKALPRGSQPRLAFPHARLAVLKECGFLLPSQTSGLSWLGCSAACLHRLPGSCLLFLSRRAGERVREGQMVLHCFFCLKACSFFFSKISSIGS